MLERYSHGRNYRNEQIPWNGSQSLINIWYPFTSGWAGAQGTGKDAQIFPLRPIIELEFPQLRVKCPNHCTTETPHHHRVLGFVISGSPVHLSQIPIYRRGRANCTPTCLCSTKTKVNHYMAHYKTRYKGLPFTCIFFCHPKDFYKPYFYIIFYILQNKSPKCFLFQSHCLNLS